MNPLHAGAGESWHLLDVAQPDPSSEPTGANLRVEGRAPLMAKIEIKGTLRRYDVACRDVSATGLGIAVEPDVELDVGDVVETSIQVLNPDAPAEDTNIWVVSEVRWVSEGSPTLVGLEFISRLQASEVSAIRALIAENTPPLAATG